MNEEPEKGKPAWFAVELPRLSDTPDVLSSPFKLRVATDQPSGGSQAGFLRTQGAWYGGSRCGNGGWLDGSAGSRLTCAVGRPQLLAQQEGADWHGVKRWPG